MRENVLDNTSRPGKLQGRVLYALMHPNCPTILTQYEMEALSKHIAVRLSNIWKKQGGSDD